MDDNDNPWANFYENLDSDSEEIIEEQVKESQQDEMLHKIVEKVIEVDKDKYLLLLAQLGVKLSHDFDVSQLKSKEDERNPIASLMKQIKSLQQKIQDI